MPLSNPGKPASVDVGLVLGSIRVVAGNAGEVVIEAQRGSEDDDEDCEDCGPVSGKAKDKPAKEGKTLEGGLRKITNASIDLSAEEDGNKVTVRSSGIPRHLQAAGAGAGRQLATALDGVRAARSTSRASPASSSSTTPTARSARAACAAR